MDAAGFGDGLYELGPMKVEVATGWPGWCEGGSIAGSTLTMDTRVQAGRDGRRDLARRRRPGGVGEPGAAAGALDDRIGSLEPGKDADLVVLDGSYDVAGVMRKGEWVTPPPAVA